jgi:hypothetical protein
MDSQSAAVSASSSAFMPQHMMMQNVVGIPGFAGTHLM